jgi:asparagine synthase (glutamine-hydrolysing)
MQDFMPESILNRKKQGFSAPDESWYRGENLDYVKDLLLNTKNESADLINQDFVKKKLQEHIDGEANHRLLIWSLMNVELWLKEFMK